jgi:hypothetical protein
MASFPERTFWAYPWDLADGELNAQLERVRELGANALSVPFSYHSLRALAPHHSGRKVFQTQASICFLPGPGEFSPDGIQPVCSPWSTEEGPVVGLAQSVREQGMRLRAWTVVFHNTPLASANPESAITNCFGDVFAHALCPSAPRSREYAKSLARAVAARPVDAIELEACGFYGYEHQSHHDKFAVILDLFHHFLFSCCFCAHCRRSFERADLDAGSIQEKFRRRLASLFEGTRPAAGGTPQAALSELLGEAAAKALIEVRSATVLGLIREIRGVVPAGVEMTVSSGLSPFECSALLGAEPKEITQWADRLLLVVFEPDDHAFRERFRAARKALPDTSRWIAGIRAFPPDVAEESALRTRLNFLADEGFPAVHVYHYGLATNGQLRSISRAWRSLERTELPMARSKEGCIEHS